MSGLPTVLVVDDEVRSVESLRRTLEDEFDVLTATSAAEARAHLEHDFVEIVLCDQRMPEMSGVEFLKQVREEWPDVVRMIISGYTESEDIISGVNEAGIYQYITKPWQPEMLLLTLHNASRLFRLQRHNQQLAVELKVAPGSLESDVADKREALRSAYDCDDGMVRGPGSPMHSVCDRIRQIAPYDISVLLAGESGTGKELAARALHYQSRRWEQPFVGENCAALPDDLLESELFGYKKGAFTGAVEDRIGLFERAQGGTVFLDEIGEVSPAFQVKLLRVLQEGEIRPLGASRTRKVDVRVIAASNKDLDREMREGRFREDLYYRLATVTVELPPLRDRRGDIPLLAESLLKSSVKALGKPARGFTDEAVACMQTYAWPGNVRELQNEIRHMLVMAEGEILGAELLSSRVLRALPAADGAADDTDADDWLTTLDGTLKDRVETLEARILRETLIRNRWNKSRAARELGLSRVGLRGKLERYGLAPLDNGNGKRPS